MTVEYFIPVNGEYVNLNTFPEEKQKEIMEDYGRRYKEAVERILSAKEDVIYEEEEAENLKQELINLRKELEDDSWMTVPEITDPRELLSALKCINEVQEIRSFKVNYKKTNEISYSLETELGALVARIERMPDPATHSMKDVSMIDYCNCNYLFDRNADLVSELPH